MASLLFPAYYPLPAPPRKSAAPLPVRPPHPRLAPDCWPEIAARAEYESLRQIAVAYEVSHETIRAIIQRAQYLAHPAMVIAD